MVLQVCFKMYGFASLFWNYFFFSFCLERYGYNMLSIFSYKKVVGTWDIFASLFKKLWFRKFVLKFMVFLFCLETDGFLFFCLAFCLKNLSSLNFSLNKQNA